ncbi:hypothetical protein [Stutzerimonas nitrititolerans]|uniref:hypothetical protein n=1 Tax=Stutzerimonas nitrititolerans TaxID=2482751 RepID=UPI0028972728|nr:hypothetical protein [Stutzerimonas nitrititolerans]
MNVGHLWLVAILGVTTGAMADNTGPTHPEKSREHPLDNREPRQDIIERPQERDAVPVPPPGSDDSLPPTPTDPNEVPVPRFDAAGGGLPWPPDS